VILKYLRDDLRTDRIPEDTVLAYRGGYLPLMRRNIEARLRAGEIRCVVATTRSSWASTSARSTRWSAPATREISPRSGSVSVAPAVARKRAWR